jgi:hypothetical protein
MTTRMNDDALVSSFFFFSSGGVVGVSILGLLGAVDTKLSEINDKLDDLQLYDIDILLLSGISHPGNWAARSSG